jgi:hypothetical protein
MRGAVSDQFLTASLWVVYTVAAAAVIIWSALRASADYGSLLAEALRQPWAALGIYLPILLGLGVQLAGRRFWAWPYVYLLVLVLGMSGAMEDLGDQMYAYGGSAVWVLTVFAAESVGLTLGRWLHRYVGIAFFLGAGCWMLIEALRGREPGPVGRWQTLTLVLAGALLLVHAAIQGNLYLRRQRSEQALLKEPAPPPAQPRLVDQSKQRPWHIMVGQEPSTATDAESPPEDNTKHV